MVSVVVGGDVYGFCYHPCFLHHNICCLSDIVSCCLLGFCQLSAMFRVTSCSFVFSYNGVDVLPRHCRRNRTQFLNSYIEEPDIGLLTGRVKSA